MEDVLFRSELGNLKGFGVEVSDLEPEELVALVHAVDRLKSPFSHCNADAVGMPIEICEGKYLWKLTIGASVWLEEYAKRWWLDRGMNKAYYWALVFALIHARDCEAFIGMTDEKSSKEKVVRECATIGATEDEIADAVDLALEVKSGTSGSSGVNQQTDWATIIARLEGQTGISAKVWCWDKSADYALRVHNDLRHFAEASNGVRSTRMKDELDAATNALVAVRTRIIERVTKAKKEAQEAVNESGN